jgi:hypothetical protein
MAKKFKHSDESVKVRLSNLGATYLSMTEIKEFLVESAKERGLYVMSVTPFMGVVNTLNEYFNANAHK